MTTMRLVDAGYQPSAEPASRRISHRAAELVASRRQEEHRESEAVEFEGTGYFDD